VPLPILAAPAIFCPPKLPKGATLQSTHQALLPIAGPLAQLSLRARQANVFPGITGKALVSIGQLWDHGYDAIFTASSVTLSKNGHITTIGHREPSNSLWTIPFVTPVQTPTRVLGTTLVNNAYEMRTIRDLVVYLHRTCFSPARSTWTDAIDAGFFTTWPGLTAALVRKHLPKSLATAKGHLKQDVRWTKPAGLPTPPANSPTTHAEGTPAFRTLTTFAKILPLSGTAYSDQTGRFPHTSSRGTKYVMIPRQFSPSL
jgi:hypothetical protein